jgi:hypothetical protein
VSLCVVLASSSDLHADAVINEIGEQHTVVRIDPLQPLPTIAFWAASRRCQIGCHRFQLDEITGVFCRVALDALGGSIETDAITRFSFRESVAAISGVFLNVPSVKWLNFPWSEALAEGKIYPLLVARGLGLNVPDFIVSNSRTTLLDFHKSQNETVIKPLSDASIAYQNGQFVEFPEIAEFDAPYTAEFDPLLLSSDLAEEETPSLLQKKISRQGDVRVVLVDGQVFATYLAGSPHTDSRLVKHRAEICFNLPDDLSNALIHLVHTALRLRFATLDLVHGVDDEFYLVDINPSGNWLWQQLALGIPIASAIAASLTRQEPG